MAEQTHEFETEFKVFQAEVKADLKSLSVAVDGIHRQLDSVVAMRDEITRMAAGYEQWRSEKQAMWDRIDGHGTAIKALKEKADREHGIAVVARWFFGLVATGMVGAVGVLIADHSDLQVLKQQIRGQEVRK